MILSLPTLNLNLVLMNKRVLFTLILTMLSNICFAQIMKLSVSGDGNHIVSTNLGKQAVFWDLKKRTKKLISTNANIYSAYFDKNSGYHIWQDLDDVVHVQNDEHTEVNSFSSQPSYGGVYDAKTSSYTYANYAGDIIFHSNNKDITYKGYLSALGASKLYDMSFDSSHHYLLTALYCGSKYESIQIGSKNSLKNFSCVTLWNELEKSPIVKYWGVSSKTTAAISPDHKWIVIGDEAGQGMVINTNERKNSFYLDDIIYGHTIDASDLRNIKFDKSHWIKPPKDFKSIVSIDGFLAIKFIDNTHYLRFRTYIPYAILYDVNKPYPLKYLPLGRNPFPSVNDYTRNQSIDASPSAHILVTGQANADGINVYRYDPVTKTMKLVWSPNGKFSRRQIALATPSSKRTWLQKLLVLL